MMRFFQTTLAALLLADAAAFQAGAAHGLVRSAVNTRPAAITMDGVKGPSEWVFVKGINDYGKEQTYMFLGPKKDAAVEKNAAEEALGEWGFLASPYFIALFTPLVLCALTILPPPVGIDLPEFKGVDVPINPIEIVSSILGTIAGLVAKTSFDIWNIICVPIGLGGAILKY